MRTRIAVIGGGASAVSFCALSAKRLNNCDITVFEKNDDIGLGLAYAPKDPYFLLNVPAAKMGLFADNSSDFYHWLKSTAAQRGAWHEKLAHKSIEATDFAPRMLYGAYLQDRFETAIKIAPERGNTLKVLQKEISKVSPIAHDTKHKLKLEAQTGYMDEFDVVLLATGNSLPKSLPIIHKAEAEAGVSQAYPNPYHAEFYNKAWGADDHIICIGTGLSMVDAVHVLSEKNYQGRFTAISRRGLLPFAHLPKTAQYTVPSPFLEVDTMPEKLSELIRCIREHLSQNQEGAALPWQIMLDSLRPVANTLWHSLSAQDQKRMMRIMPWWNVARHRIPDYVHKKLMDMQASGQLQIVKSHIETIQIQVAETGGIEKKPVKELIEVTLKNGGLIKGSAVVNCSGYSYNAAPLQKICSDIPLSTHWSGSLQAASAQSLKVSQEYPIYAIGPLLCGAEFESTAIHEIRSHAALLVSELLEKQG
ncbi:MAG: FAD/NAD(P)-binding protein [Alphaproteobacteria bacterium]